MSADYTLLPKTDPRRPKPSSVVTQKTLAHFMQFTQISVYVIAFVTLLAFGLIVAALFITKQNRDDLSTLRGLVSQQTLALNQMLSTHMNQSTSFAVLQTTLEGVVSTVQGHSKELATVEQGLSIVIDPYKEYENNQNTKMKLEDELARLQSGTYMNMSAPYLNNSQNMPLIMAVQSTLGVLNTLEQQMKLNLTLLQANQDADQSVQNILSAYNASGSEILASIASANQIVKFLSQFQPINLNLIQLNQQTIYQTQFLSSYVSNLTSSTANQINSVSQQVLQSQNTITAELQSVNATIVYLTNTAFGKNASTDNPALTNQTVTLVNDLQNNVQTLSSQQQVIQQIANALQTDVASNFSQIYTQLLTLNQTIGSNIAFINNQIKMGINTTLDIQNQEIQTQMATSALQQTFDKFQNNTQQILMELQSNISQSTASIHAYLNQTSTNLLLSIQNIYSTSVFMSQQVQDLNNSLNSYTSDLSSVHAHLTTVDGSIQSNLNQINQLFSLLGLTASEADLLALSNQTQLSLSSIAAAQSILTTNVSLLSSTIFTLQNNLAQSTIQFSILSNLSGVENANFSQSISSLQFTTQSLLSSTADIGQSLISYETYENATTNNILDLISSTAWSLNTSIYTLSGSVSQLQTQYYQVYQWINVLNTTLTLQNSVSSSAITSVQTQLTGVIVNVSLNSGILTGVQTALNNVNTLVAGLQTASDNTTTSLLALTTTVNNVQSQELQTQVAALTLQTSVNQFQNSTQLALIQLQSNISQLAVSLNTYINQTAINLLSSINNIYYTTVYMSQQIRILNDSISNNTVSVLDTQNHLTIVDTSLQNNLIQINQLFTLLNATDSQQSVLVLYNNSTQLSLASFTSAQSILTTNVSILTSSIISIQNSLSLSALEFSILSNLSSRSLNFTISIDALQVATQSLLSNTADIRQSLNSYETYQNATTNNILNLITSTTLSLNSSINTLFGSATQLQTQFTQLAQSVNALNVSLATQNQLNIIQNVATSSAISSIQTQINVFSGNEAAINITLIAVQNSVSNINSQVTNLNAISSSFNVSLLVVNSNMSTISTTVNTLSSSLNTLTTTVNTLSTSLNTVNTTVSTLATSLNALAATVSTLSNSFNTLNTTVFTLATFINNVNTTVSSLNLNLNSNVYKFAYATNITALNASLNLLQVAESATQNQLNAVNTTVVSLTTTVQTLNSSLLAYQALINPQITSILITQSGQFTFLNSTLTSLTTTVQVVNTSLIAYQALINPQITSILSTQTSYGTSIVALQTLTTSIQTTIGQIQTSIAGVQTNLTLAVAGLNSQSTSISNTFNSQIGSLNTSVASIQAINVNTVNSLLFLNTSVASIQAQAVKNSANFTTLFAQISQVYASLLGYTTTAQVASIQTTLQNSINVVSAQETVLNGNVSSLQTQINAVIATATATQAALQGQITALSALQSSQYASLVASLNAVNNNITALNTSQSNQYTSLLVLINGVINNVSIFQGQLATETAIVTGIQTSLNNYVTYTTFNALVASNTFNITYLLNLTNSLKTSVTTLTNSVASVQASITAINAQLLTAATQSQITSLQNQINTISTTITTIQSMIVYTRSTINFKSVTSFAWQCPIYYSSARIFAFGGGGGGGGSSSVTGGGGGSGAAFTINLVPGAFYVFTTGVGGINPGGASGTTGTSTTVAWNPSCSPNGGSCPPFNTITAHGGYGGKISLVVSYPDLTYNGKGALGGDCILYQTNTTDTLSASICYTGSSGGDSGYYSSGQNGVYLQASGANGATFSLSSGPYISFGGGAGSAAVGGFGGSGGGGGGPNGVGGVGAASFVTPLNPAAFSGAGGGGGQNSIGGTGGVIVTYYLYDAPGNF